MTSINAAGAASHDGSRRALERLDRDVPGQPGARWLILLEGDNDLGTSAAARAARLR